jgi:hypothetical protein
MFLAAFKMVKITMVQFLTNKTYKFYRLHSIFDNAYITLPQFDISSNITNKLSFLTNKYREANISVCMFNSINLISVFYSIVPGKDILIYYSRS